MGMEEGMVCSSRACLLANGCILKHLVCLLNFLERKE
jgi:hypothetical protein